MTDYVPHKGDDWATLSPEEAGFNHKRHEAAPVFAWENESHMDRDIGKTLEQGHFDEPSPDGDVLGPTEPRGDPAE